MQNIKKEQVGDITVISGWWDRIVTMDQLKEHAKYDETKHMIIQEIYNVWEQAQNKKDGSTVLVQLHQNKLVLEPKIKPVALDLVDIIKDYKPPVRDIPAHKQTKSDLLGALFLADVHVAKLPKDWWTLLQKVKKVIRSTLEAGNRLEDMGCKEYLIAILGDYFNSDHAWKTTKGTQQENLASDKDEWKAGIDITWSIGDEMSKKGIVKKRLVWGNHDDEKILYLHTALKYIFQNNPNVEILGDVESRQYHRHGINLLMLHHGDKIKDKDLLGLVMAENNLNWVEYIESNKGHSHTFSIADIGGRMKSITNTAVWSQNQRGYDFNVGKDHNLITSGVYHKKDWKIATLFTKVK